MIPDTSVLFNHVKNDGLHQSQTTPVLPIDGAEALGRLEPPNVFNLCVHTNFLARLKPNGWSTYYSTKESHTSGSIPCIVYITLWIIAVHRWSHQFNQNSTCRGIQRAPFPSLFSTRTPSACAIELTSSQTLSNLSNSTSFNATRLIYILFMQLSLSDLWRSQ